MIHAIAEVEKNSKNVAASEIFGLKLLDICYFFHKPWTLQ